MVSEISLNSRQNSLSENIQIWIHEHPTVVKAAKFAAIITGVGLLLSLPFTAPIMGIAFSVATGVGGVAFSMAGLLTLLFLDYFIPGHHSMSSHVYAAGECEGGKLFYDGDVPVLSLESDDPRTAGKAQGYLCGDAINRVYSRFDIGLHSILGEPRASELKQNLETVRQTIPAEYVREMEGLVEGYEQWRKENYWKFPKSLTVDDVLLFHLMPDSAHFSFDKKERAGTQRQLVACTALIERTADRGLVFARNMDWTSLGVMGTYSLVIHRKHRNGQRNTVEVSVPGTVGTLTGMNDRGLCLAMNVCHGDTNQVRGMPACFYNRSILERSSSVTDAEACVQTRSPLGPYHLTVADQNRAQSFHFYQSFNQSHVIRRLEQNRPFVTLNYCYSPEPGTDLFDSAERKRELDVFFGQRNNRPLEEALALPEVNNWGSTHRVVMEPQSGTFKVAFNNAFAGKSRLQTVNARALFAS